MKITIRTEPKFNFTIQKDMLALLMQLSSTHYDGKCQNASRQGGFLYGWNNMMYEKESCEVSATSYELHTLLKICEILAGLSDKQKYDIRNITNEFYYAINTYNNHYHESWKVVIP